MIYTTIKQLRKVRHVDGVQFKCADCGQVFPVGTSGGTGYGYWADSSTPRPVCYDCCAKRERQAMIDTGRACLYLVQRDTAWEVHDWPGRLVFRATVRTGHHNIARKRYDAWFRGPDGHIWHGVKLGDNSDIVRCKRTKETY